jgi:hypothetical protein
MLSYFSPYVPTRGRLQALRDWAEIMVLRGLTSMMRAARYEAWRRVFLWSAGAMMAGLLAGFAGTLLLLR